MALHCSVMPSVFLISGLLIRPPPYLVLSFATLHYNLLYILQYYANTIVTIASYIKKAFSISKSEPHSGRPHLEY